MLYIFPTTKVLDQLKSLFAVSTSGTGLRCTVGCLKISGRSCWKGHAVAHRGRHPEDSKAREKTGQAFGKELADRLGFSLQTNMTDHKCVSASAARLGERLDKHLGRSWLTGWASVFEQM